jgi:type IV pilus assembly protein PilA
MKKGFTHTLNFRKKLVCGFTLLEILLVVGIIAILAGIVIVAVNPSKQFSQVRNTQRKANLSELNKALYQYYIDHSHYPTSLTTTLTEICNTGASSTPTGIVCTGLIDLSALVPTYLVAIPTDPQATGTTTLYYVARNSANKVTLSAPQAELSLPVTIGDTTGVLPDHLVSYWSFDGNANDSQGTNHGTVTGAVLTTGVRGLANTAYSFDGVDDYIQIPAIGTIIAGTPFALCAWVNPNVNADVYRTIMGYGATNRLLINGDGSMLSQQNGNFNSISGDVPNNQWTYVIYWNNGSSEKWYINGVQSGSTRSISDARWNSAFKIGQYDLVNYKFKGSIDNIRIYNDTLTTEDIMLIYNTEKP